MMKHILLVDDQPHVIRLLRLCLEGDGYRIDTASNGIEALQRIRSSMPDVMITDIQMPGMGGQELCQTLQLEFPQRDFLILIMTSMTERDQREWAKSLPNTEFLEKPLSPRRLTAQLKRHFSPDTPEMAHA